MASFFTIKIHKQTVWGHSDPGRGGDSGNAAADDGDAVVPAAHLTRRRGSC